MGRCISSSRPLSLVGARQDTCGVQPETRSKVGEAGERPSTTEHDRQDTSGRELFESQANQGLQSNACSKNHWPIERTEREKPEPGRTSTGSTRISATANTLREAAAATNCSQEFRARWPQRGKPRSKQGRNKSRQRFRQGDARGHRRVADSGVLRSRAWQQQEGLRECSAHSASHSCITSGFAHESVGQGRPRGVGQHVCRTRRGL